MPDKFRTGDGPLVGAVLYRVVVPTPLWFPAEVLDALNDMTIVSNWEQVGDVTPEEAAEAASTMCELFTVIAGLVFPYITASAPQGSLPCDGATYLRVDYPTLYAILDSAFIVDADHFKVPDLRGVTIIGNGTAASGTSYSVGATGGEERHTLTSGEMPAHSHTEITAVATLVDQTTPIGAAAIPGVGVTGTTGGGGSHNNMQPYQVLKYAVWAS